MMIKHQNLIHRKYYYKNVILYLNLKKLSNDDNCNVDYILHLFKHVFFFLFFRISKSEKKKKMLKY